MPRSIAFLPPEQTPPPAVHRAMRLQRAGRRQAAAADPRDRGRRGGRWHGARGDATACALELIHTYSLIHDDLPAMDNDDYRRGRLTNHKVFGDALAILAGDALLTMAFKLIAENAALVKDRASSATSWPRSPTPRAPRAWSAGRCGYRVGGRDRHGRDARVHPHPQDGGAHPCLAARRVRLAGGDAAAVVAISDAGQSLGLAFQIIDDILDVEGSLEVLGKTAGSDERKQKATYPALHGIEASRREARRLIEATKSRLGVFGTRSAPLCALADYVVERKN